MPPSEIKPLKIENFEFSSDGENVNIKAFGLAGRGQPLKLSVERKTWDELVDHFSTRNPFEAEIDLLEVIDRVVPNSPANAHVFVKRKRNLTVKMQMQDNRRTLKIFLSKEN